MKNWLYKTGFVLLFAVAFAWGVEETNNLTGTMTDSRDGKAYKTVKIGTQIWMAENLNYNAANSYCYRGKASNCTKYGRLYTWATAATACPEGWHLPSKDEWEKLFTAVGGESTAGKALKSTSGWNNYHGESGNGTDAFGFSALPAGYRDDDGDYLNEGDDVYFWSSTEDNSGYVYDMYLYYNLDLAYLRANNKNNRFSVRCLKDDDGMEEPVVEESKDIGKKNISSGTLVDNRDGKTYKTVKIGTQIWMAENLNYDTANSYCYGDDASNCNKYGRLYTWAAAKTACPEGWHLPSDDEWKTLFMAVGGVQDEDDDRKWRGIGTAIKFTSGWNHGGAGTDAFGFSALPAGSRVFDMAYGNEGSVAYFWSSTEYESGDTYSMNLYYDQDYAGLYFTIENNGYSVRCLKDNDDGMEESAVEKSKDIGNKIGSSGTLVDKRDGKTYKTVKIGTQTWMAENLNYKTANSYCYSDNASNCTKYGRLYTWVAAKAACPEGWHLPRYEEIQPLFSAVGGVQDKYDDMKWRGAGTALKSTSGWNYEGNGTDAFGFSSLPAGSINNGRYIGEGVSANFWISTESDSYSAYFMGWNRRGDDAYLSYSDKDRGYTVRCLKNGESKDNGKRNSSTGTLVDKRDGKKYRTVKIGAQTWMAENLNYKTANSYCYSGSASNCTKYGRLYTWATAKTACPRGWHLPSKAEWKNLFTAVRGESIDGKKLKSISGWINGGNGTDAFGFTALPAGNRNDDGLYDGEGVIARFWSSTESNIYLAYFMSLIYSNAVAELYDYSKSCGFSVRCLKD